MNKNVLKIKTKKIIKNKTKFSDIIQSKVKNNRQKENQNKNPKNFNKIDKTKSNKLLFSHLRNYLKKKYVYTSNKNSKNEPKKAQNIDQKFVEKDQKIEPKFVEKKQKKTVMQIFLFSESSNISSIPVIDRT